MTTAWTRALAASLLVLPLACEVKVNEGDPIDGFGGDAGSGGEAGNSASQGGGGNGGSAMSGGGGNGGEGGTEVFPAPSCSAETADDECIQCLKQQCCDAWLGCNDFTCDDEWNSVAECVSDIYTAEQFADDEDFGMCVTASSADDTGLAQMNTNTLLDCINEPEDVDGGFGATRCGVPCFGTDIFF